MSAVPGSIRFPFLIPNMRVSSVELSYAGLRSSTGKWPQLMLRGVKDEETPAEEPRARGNGDLDKEL